jgi:hypothetical protein
MYGQPLPGQAPPATRALTQQEAEVDGARGDKAEIPDSPPDRAVPKANGTEARTPVVQIIGAKPLAVEQSLVVSVAALDALVTHGPPFLGLQAQQLGDSFIGIRVLQIISWQPGEPYKGKRTNVVMLISDAAQIPSWTLQREWINAK